MKRIFEVSRIKGIAEKNRLAVMAMAAMVSMWGCGNSPEDAQVSNVSEEGAQDVAGQGETASDAGGKEEEETRQPADGEAEGMDGGNVQAEGEEGETAGGNAQAAGGQGDGTDSSVQGAGQEGQETINGMIEEVGDKRFTMELLVSSMDEENGLVLVGGDPDGKRTEVNYTEDTVFTRKVTTDGITSTVQPGSAEDIKADILVYVTGVWDGDILQAEAIEIFVDER